MKFLNVDSLQFAEAYYDSLWNGSLEFPRKKLRWSIYIMIIWHIFCKIYISYVFLDILVTTSREMNENCQ